MACWPLHLKETRKKADFEAQLRLIQDFGVFHDFGEIVSGGPTKKGD
jgi:hypothetical protein